MDAGCSAASLAGGFNKKAAVKACFFSSITFFFFFLSRGRARKTTLFARCSGWREVGRGARSLWQVVEAHGHTDVAGEADVDAEVDQPQFVRP